GCGRPPAASRPGVLSPADIAPPDCERGFVTQPLRYQGARDRRMWILSTLHTVGFLSIAELTRHLGVSHMTVRRDLRILQASGQVRTVRGGASLAPAALRRRGFPYNGNLDGLRRIAARAVQFVAVTDTIAVGAGAAAY